ncbi:MAG: alpha/beta hydrolase [Promethearchaeota archaeon]
MRLINNPKNIKYIPLIFLSILIVGAIGFNITPTDIKIKKNLSVVTDDGVKLYFDVYEPKNNNSLNKKAIILGHGVMINKEVMRLIAIELTHLDFVVVAFDFRGHGLSGGDFNFIGESFDLEKLQQGDHEGLFNFQILANDIKTIKQKYLGERGDIDIHNLGYIGYSMGGGAGFVALSEDNDFAAMVGLCPSPEFKYVNQTNPRNLLVLASKYDEAISLEEILFVMENKTGVNRGLIYQNITQNADHSWTFPNGNVSEGTAARIYYNTRMEHFLAAWDYSYIKEIRNWMYLCLYNQPTPLASKPMVYALVVTFYIIQAFGAIGLFICILKFLLEKFANKTDKSNLLFPVEFLAKQPIRKSLLKSMLFIIPLSFPCMLLFAPFYALPLLITDFQLMLMFGPSVTILIFIIYYFRKSRETMNTLANSKDIKDLPSKNTEQNKNSDKNQKSGFKRGFNDLRQIYRIIYANSTKNNILLGFLIGFLYYFTIYLTIGQLFSIMPSIYDWIWVPFYIILTIFIYSNFIILFQGDIQEKIMLTSKSQISATIKTIIFNFSLNIAFSIFVLFTPSVILGNYFIAMFIVAVILLHILTVLISTIIYSKTRDLLMTMIATSILPCLMFSTLSPFIWVGNFL